ncbi:GxxExxY protein|uniref:GxxExxY protein n=2 Tax=Dendrosporobacter quercicolus TaxID=146817 RepID=A0A1G9WSZ5_9FIRM|nr:GxxExxY protein [Dendrosporobacter quercicolus DSM 1736]SDM87361.1 GxxExxY protein [Dendrosporobacter quercicolus]
MDKRLDERMDSLTGRVIGAALEVHSILGPGYLESIYEEALAREFNICGIAYERQKPVAIDYKGYAVGAGRLDFLIEHKVILELKAVESIAAIHTAQILSYLKMTGLRVGMIINFNVTSLRSGIKRIIK